ncbi:MAG TPA: amidohydrolase family protein [Candidatus Nesterenkonia stercoripullorum]|uniref:Amidohydrolase family protein n=1 Tax=Candidatus Nesterenkonia stercoripullorum TaxID=2838701 RepID=A0A9D2A8P5_9MICC|nr:amidohydrolase family protein [Candidatus Nesterenkonia stercoripullorum]
MTTRIINAALPSADAAGTILIEDGRITAVETDPATGHHRSPRTLPSGTGVSESAASEIGAPETIDAGGRLVLPGLINAHAHIDKTLYGGPWVSAVQAESVAERIAHERRERDALGLPSPQYISALIETMVAAGTAHIRTHTDVDPGVGLLGITTVAEVAQRYAHAVDVEQVAFPQGGLITNPGTLDLLRDAVDAGATAIGGLDPAGFDNAPNAHLEAIFTLAASTGTRLDIHLHDGGTLGAWEMSLIADMTEDFDLAGRVAISHAFGIDHAPTQLRLLERFAEAGIALVNAAVYDSPVPPLRACAEAGVTVAGGTDGINDLWGPFGDGDMLRRAMLLAYRNEARADRELELALDTVTTNAARVLGIDDYGLEPGRPADLTIVEARSAAEAVATVPKRRIVLKSGRPVARDGAFTGATAEGQAHIGSSA